MNNKEEQPSREEVFAKMNASAERMLAALQKAYQEGTKEDISAEQEDQLIKLLAGVKKLHDEIKDLTGKEKQHCTENDF